MAKPILSTKDIHELWNVNPTEGTILHKFNSPSSRIGDPAGSITDDGYIHIGKRIKGNYYKWYAHNLIWVAAGNNWPEKRQHIHHKDENKTNNRLDNLILLSVNTHKNIHLNRGDMHHISFHIRENIYIVRLPIDGKPTYIGYSIDFDEAKLMRDIAIKKLIALGQLLCPE